MPSITIRNIPEDVLDKIKERAKKERRSLNNEIIKRLEEPDKEDSWNRDDLIKFLNDWNVDEDYISGVREAISNRTYGRDINLDQ